MNTFMVMAKFKPETDMQAVFALRDQEIAAFDALKSEGRLGLLRVAMAKKTVFIEVFAPDEASVEATIALLPMAQFWTLDIYPTPAPPPPGTVFK